MPYFGRWPPWIEFFLETCRWNPGICWRFFSDCGTPRDLPVNVTVEPLTLLEFLQRAEWTLGISLKWRSTYKLCDLRLAFGDIFKPAVEGFDYFGWGDLDVVYGGLESFIAELLHGYDCIAFNRKHLSGSLCLFRNDDRSRGWYRQLPDWRTRMESEEYTRLDEISPTRLRYFLKVYAEESYNTPLSPYIRWTDGTFDFPLEWFWKDGVLTNDKDGDRRFPYLHFMHWKGGPWPRRCGNAQWERLDQLVHLRPAELKQGFRINERGFFPLFVETPKADIRRARSMRVSIIIPVYNNASTLGDTLASVRRQSYSHWEAVIVDDGSTDDSLAIACAAAESDPRFHVIRQSNRGASAARNTGIGQATSDWLLLLDADDWIAPNHLEVMTAALRSKSDLDAVVCKWVNVYKNDKQRPARRCRDLDQLFAQTVAGCPFAIHACLVRKRVVDGVDGFNEELRTCVDWHFWQKIARSGAKFGSVDEVLAFYRKQSPDSLSSNFEQLLQDALTVFQIGLADTDPAVKTQLIDHTDRKFVEALTAAKYNALLYWGMARICRGKSADAYWDQITPGLELKTSVQAIAQRILAAVMKFHSPGEDGSRVWPQVQASVLEFLERLEALTGVPRLAARVTRSISLLLLRGPGGNGSLLAGLCGVSVEALAEIPDVTVPADAMVEAIVVSVTVAGRPVGSVCLRPSGSSVAAKSIQDRIADGLAPEIIHRIMAQPDEPQPKPRPHAVNAAAFCKALLANDEAGGEDTKGPSPIAYDGTMPVAVELMERLPDIVATAGQDIAVAASVGGAALGKYRIPAPGGQVSGQMLSRAIRKLAGVDLARVCLREAVVGHPPATIEEIKQRLRRQAELFARKRLNPHQAVQQAPLSANRVADTLLVQPGSSPSLSAGLTPRPRRRASEHPVAKQFGWVNSLPILAYHRIAHFEEGSLERCCVTPEQFACQLAFLHDAGFYSIDWQSLELHLRYGLPLPGRPIAITFGDGHRDFADTAFPILRKHGFTATVFVSPADVGSANVWDGSAVPLLDWSDIGELAKSHISFGSRGLTHQPLTGISAVEAGSQLVRSRQILEDRLGSKISVVAYPYGDFDPLVEHLASDAGYAMGLTTSVRQCRLSDRPMALPSIEVHRGLTFDRFVETVTHRAAKSVPTVRKICGFLEDINRPDLALATARDWTEACSGDPAFHFHLARLLDRRGLPTEAIESYRRTVELEPSRPDYTIRLAMALEEQALRGEALEVVERQAAQMPEHPGLQECLGVLLRRAGRHAEAANALLRATSLNPDSTRAHLHLIAAFKSQGRIDEAVRLAKSCTVKFPAHAGFSKKLRKLISQNCAGAITGPGQP